MRITPRAVVRDAKAGASQTGEYGVAIGDQAVRGPDPGVGLLGNLVDGIPVAARLLLAWGAGQQVREVGRGERPDCAHWRLTGTCGHSGTLVSAAD